MLVVEEEAESLAAIPGGFLGGAASEVFVYQQGELLPWVWDPSDRMVPEIIQGSVWARSLPLLSVLSFFS